MGCQKYFPEMVPAPFRAARGTSNNATPGTPHHDIAISEIVCGNQS